MTFPNGTACVAPWGGDPLGASRRPMRDIGQAAQRRGRPPGHNPKGRGPLRRGCVAGLARSPTTCCTPLLTAPQMAPAQTIPFGKVIL